MERNGTERKIIEWNAMVLLWESPSRDSLLPANPRVALVEGSKECAMAKKKHPRRKHHGVKRWFSFGCPPRCLSPLKNLDCLSLGCGLPTFRPPLRLAAAGRPATARPHHPRRGNKGPSLETGARSGEVPHSARPEGKSCTSEAAGGGL